MTTSAVRFAIIVGFIAAAVVVLSQFPDSSTSAQPSASQTPTESATPSATGGGQANQGGGEETPAPVEGVRLAVYNGTTQTGLASETAARLEKHGYKINPDTSILNADAAVEQTTLYFVTPADKPAAEALATGYFKKLDVKIEKLPADSQVPNGVQVAVYLGTDYAALH
jgi:hypothetical protein